MRRDGTMDREEEDYFEQDDDDVDTSAPPVSPAPALTLRLPPKRSLVDYADDDEEEEEGDDSAASGRPLKRARVFGEE